MEILVLLKKYSRKSNIHTLFGILKFVKITAASAEHFKQGSILHEYVLYYHVMYTCIALQWLPIFVIIFVIYKEG